MANSNKKRRREAIKKYRKSPRICKCCHRIIPIRNSKVTIVRKRKFCSIKCSQLYRQPSLKDKILKLFHDGNTYLDITNKLKCSKGTISYHCGKLRPKDKRYTNANIRKYQKHYDTYMNVRETAEYFNVSVGTLKNYLTLKRKKTPKKELRRRRGMHATNWRRRIKVRAIEYKGGRCQNCQYENSVYSLDFHHVNPNKKEFGISSSKVNNWSKIKAELDKCVLVCKNCHGEIHEEINLKGKSDILKKILSASG